MPALLEGIKLVRSIDAAQLARYGVRSNDVVNQLLVIAKVWIADETAARGAGRGCCCLSRSISSACHTVVARAYYISSVRGRPAGAADPDDGG